MTENKRFNYTTENGFVVDYESEQKLLNLYDTVDLLNELNDKNKQLRKENYEFLDEIASLNEVQIPNISKKISDLEYENEQLRQQNQRIFDLIDEKIKFAEFCEEEYSNPYYYRGASDVLKVLKKELEK